MIVVERFNGSLECVEKAVRGMRNRHGELVCVDDNHQKVATFRADEWRGCTRNVTLEEVEKIFAGKGAGKRPSEKQKREALRDSPYSVDSGGTAYSI